MPFPVDSFDQLLLVAAGGVLWWLGGVVKTWLSNSTKARRLKVDRESELEHLLQEYVEYSWELRNLLMESGQFSRDELPVPPRKR